MYTPKGCHEFESRSLRKGKPEIARFRAFVLTIRVKLACKQIVRTKAQVSPADRLSLARAPPARRRDLAASTGSEDISFLEMPAPPARRRGSRNGPHDKFESAYAGQDNEKDYVEIAPEMTESLPATLFGTKRVQIRVTKSLVCPVNLNSDSDTPVSLRQQHKGR